MYLYCNNMPIIINSEVLSDLINNNEVSILKKRQQNPNNSNYYFIPSLGLNLWNSKVIFKSPKFIVLEFNKVEHINLLTLLRNINIKLQTLLKQKNSELYGVNIYGIMTELENTFTIRCYLPSYKGKYLVNYSINNKDELFKLPLNGTIIDNCLVEIRNIWKMDDKCGFNIELKSVKFNI